MPSESEGNGSGFDPVKI